MTYRILPAAAALAVASFSILAAQVGPSAPTNLRLFSNAPPIGGPGHAYFDSLVALPQHHRSWSLRDQAQINSVSGSSRKVNTYFTYDPANDDYHTPQDACRFRIRAGQSANPPTGEQLWLDIGKKESGSVLITWDWWWGPEWRTHRHADFRALKTWQVMLGTTKGWWTVYNMWTSLGTTNPDVVSVASNTIRLNGGNAPGNPSRDPFKPTGEGAVDGRTYNQVHGRWIRYWVEIKYFQPPEAFTEWSKTVLGGAPLGPNPRDPQGRWHMISQWTADEERGARRLLFRVPVMPDANLGWPTWVGRFRHEVNTSQSFRYTHDMTAYTRNTVVLFDYNMPAVPETDAFLFQKPRK